MTDELDLLVINDGTPHATLRAGVTFHAANIKTLLFARDDLDRKIEANRHIIHACYAELLEVPSHDLEIGTRGCPPTLTSYRFRAPGELERIRTENPLGTCVYNRDEDPSLDCCLFCEEPDERK